MASGSARLGDSHIDSHANRRKGKRGTSANGDRTQCARPGSRRDRLERLRGRLLEIVIERFDGKSAEGQLQGVTSFDVKEALWDMPTSEPLSNDQITSLFDALNSLQNRGLLKAEFASGGMFNATPTALGREFAAETVHPGWIGVFSLRLEADRLAFLESVCALSVRRSGEVLQLVKVSEFDVMIGVNDLPSISAQQAP